MDSNACVHHGSPPVLISNRRIVHVKMADYVCNYLIIKWHVVADMVILAKRVKTETYAHPIHVPMVEVAYLTEALFDAHVKMVSKAIYAKFVMPVVQIHA